MGTQPRRVRARRNDAQVTPVVAVIGAASPPGRAVAARLAGRDDVRQVVAIDSVRGDVEHVNWRIVDLTDPALVTRLDGVDVVIHAAVDVGVTDDVHRRSRHNVRGTQTILTAAAAAGVRRVVVVTSAMVYGAAADNAVPLDEDAPLRAPADGGRTRGRLSRSCVPRCWWGRRSTRF